MKNAALLLLIVLSSAVQAQQGKPAPGRGWLTIDTITADIRWIGTSPRGVFWSEDGRRVYFNWRRQGDEGDSLYSVDGRGGTPRKVTLEERKQLPSRDGDYTKDFRKKVYSRNGDLFVLDLRTMKEARLMKTLSQETSPRFTKDEEKVVFLREGNLFMRRLEDGFETQLSDLRSGAAPEEAQLSAQRKFLEQEQLALFETLRKRKKDREAAEALRKALQEKGPKTFFTGRKTASRLQLSPDERYVTFTLNEQSSNARRTNVPSYVTESGYTEELSSYEKVGDAQGTSQFYLYDLARDSVVRVKTDSIPGIIPAKATEDTSKGKPKPREVRVDGPYWSDDGRKSFVQLFSADNKDRWIVMLECDKGALATAVYREHNDAWLDGFSRRVGWVPDRDRIYFQSEEDGYAHLYTVAPDGSEKKQLTKGAFEVEDISISRDRKLWYFTSNEVHFGEKHCYRMPIEGGERSRLTTKEGQHDAFLSPDGKRIALLSSFSNRMPELYLMDCRPGAPAQRVTDSPSPAFLSYDWRAPEVLTFPARDGAPVPARLYKPETPNGAAVFFVHGAGYLQNAHKGWSSYVQSYMFHNMLADRGYTVLDIDYRGSAGLGRDWRTAIYRQMGGKDLEDHVDGARWLVEKHGIDSNRIGIYGGSYGGFLTLMAMFRTPGVFAAGAALRPVTDWAHYHGGYTGPILNLPQDDSAAYRQSSPIYFAEGLRGALLICHGVVDVNVHFQDAVRLVQRLIELRKENWEIALYPVEDHGFRESSSWADEFKRILRLFERNLGSR